MFYIFWQTSSISLPGNIALYEKKVTDAKRRGNLLKGTSEEKQKNQAEVDEEYDYWQTCAILLKDQVARVQRTIAELQQELQQSKFHGTALKDDGIILKWAKKRN